MTWLRERQTHFSSSILVVDIRVALMHARTDEEICVKVLSGVKSSRFWRLQAAVNGKRKGSKHWQEFSCDKLVTNMLSNRTTSIRVFTEGFVIIWTWNSTATIFSTSNLEVLADEFKNNFLVWKAVIVRLKPEHWKETIFSNVDFLWKILGGMSSWIKGM